MKLPLQEKILSLSTILIVSVIALVIILSLNQVKQVDNTTKQLIQTENNLLSIQQLTSMAIHFELIAETFYSKEKSEQEIKSQKIKIAEKIADLRNQKQDTPEEQTLIDSFIVTINNSISFSDKMIDAKKANSSSDLNDAYYLKESKLKLDSVKISADNISLFENQQQKIQENDSIKEVRTLKIIFYFCIGAVFLTVFFIVRKSQVDLAYQKKVNGELIYMHELLNKTDDAIVTSRDNIIETWNKGAEKIYGYTKQETIGKNVFDIIRSRMSETGVSDFFDTIKKTGKWDGEVIHTHKNGEPINLLVSITKIDDESSNNYFVSISKDITQKKKDDEKILLLGSLLENNNEAIITVDNNLNIITWNAGAERVYGYSEKEALGKFEPDFLPVDPQTAYDIVEQIKDFETGGYWSGECIHKTKTGKKINVSISITVVQNSIKESKDYVCIISDITSRKKAEEDSIKLSEILNSTDDAIYITTKDTVITSWNKGAEKLYSYTASEVIGKKSIDVLRIKKTLIDFKTFDFSKNYFTKKESIHFDKKGNPIIVDVSLSYNATENSNGYFLVILSDITEKKKAEEKINHLASIIQLSNDAIYTTDKDFRIISWNKGAEKMYGYTEDELIGKTEYKILPAYYPIFSESNISQYENAGYFKAESTHRKKDGQVFIVTISVTYLKNENGNTNGFIIIVNDITEVKKLEGKLKNFNEKLELEVIAKTKELNAVFGRVTEGFIALNNDKCFTYVNKKAGDIFKKDWKNLIGKNIEIEFEELGDTFFKAYNKAIKTQQYLYFEDFFKLLNSWIEIHFYPSIDGVSVYFKDVTRQKQIQEDIIKLNYRFRNLATHLQNSREEERINIAREIHDELGQMATAIKIDLSWMKKRIQGENEEVRTKMDNTILELGEMVNTIRRIAQELRPSILDNLGLTAAIEWYCGDFQKRTSIQCNFKNNVGDIALPNNVKTNLFRICQESLTNVMRHSSASKVECSLQKTGKKIILIIEDNGAGFDTSQKTKSLGLLGMQERALLINGELKIESSKESGTRIKVEIDL